MNKSGRASDQNHLTTPSSIGRLTSAATAISAVQMRRKTRFVRDAEQARR